MNCPICRRRIGGTAWTMIRSGGANSPQHLACRKLVFDMAAEAAPSLTASADPKSEARMIRRVVALVRVKARTTRS